MVRMSRRSALTGSLGVAATVLARPYIANAAAKTATLWQVQGFVREEDEAFRKSMVDYEKASGNKVEYSILPFVALNQKAISAMNSGGDVPDLIFHDAPATILPQSAWSDKLVDVTDVVETYKSQLTATALGCSSFYNGAKRERSFYLAPVKQGCAPIHVWADLVEKAGFKLSDAPKTWDAFWDFFKPVQKSLRAKGVRKAYGMGLQITTVGPNDGNGLFQAFLIANGGIGIVTSDGKLHTDDPKVREAAIRSVAYMTQCYKEGYVPPEALTWNDADDNNAYHEKLIVMDYDGTLSTELAVISHKDEYYHQMAVRGLPDSNTGEPVPAVVGAGGGFIPKGARNVEVAKDIMRYLMRPPVMNETLKDGLGRWLPAIPSLVKDDPWWTDPRDPHRATYVQEGVLGPTVPDFRAYNPAMGQVNAEQLWGTCHADVIRSGMTPEAAVDKAFRRAEALFAKFAIA